MSEKNMSPGLIRFTYTCKRCKDLTFDKFFFAVFPVGQNWLLLHKPNNPMITISDLNCKEENYTWWLNIMPDEMPRLSILPKEVRAQLDCSLASLDVVEEYIRDNYTPNEMWASGRMSIANPGLRPGFVYRIDQDSARKG